MTWPTSVAVLLWALTCAPLVAGCSDSTCETCGAGGATSATGATGGGATCGMTTGELHGTVSLFAAPGSPDSQPSPGALLDLRQKPADVPLHAMADDKAQFSVELPAGAWIVGGESADTYCKTFMPKTVAVDACGSTALDVVLEACVN